MALIVDAAGKVTANPKTGKINKSSSGGGTKVSASSSGSSSGSGDVEYEDEVTDVTGSTRSSRRSTPSGNRLSYQVDAPSASVVSAPSSPMREHEVGRDKPTSYWDDVQNDNLDIVKKIDERMRASEETDDGSVPGIMKPSFITQGSSYEPGTGDMNMFGEQYNGLGATRKNDVIENALIDMGAEPYQFGGHNNRGSASIKVDNGDILTGDYTSPRVLGSQLKEYAKRGLVPSITDPNDIEKINPDEVYSKLAVGMDTYSPDLESSIDNAFDVIPNTINMMSSGLGSQREILSSIINPYEILYNDGENEYEINGSEFDKSSPGYLRSLVNDMNSGNERFFDDSHEDGGNWKQYVRRTTTQNPNGETEYHYGVVDGDWTANNVIMFDDGSVETMTDDEIEHYYRPTESVAQNDDGSWMVTFEDGTSELMSEDEVMHYYGRGIDDYEITYNIPFADGTVAEVTEDYISSLPVDKKTGNPLLDMETIDADGLGIDTQEINKSMPVGTVDDDGNKVRAIDTASSFWLPNYVMDDGTVLDFDDVLALLSDDNGRTVNENLKEGASIGYDFDSVIPFIDKVSESGVPVVSQLAQLVPTNKPRRLQGTPVSVSDDGSLDMSRFFDNTGDRFIDWFSESLPIMIPQLQWPTSLARGYESLKYGLDPAMDARNFTHSYITADRDENGNVVPTETDFQRGANALMSSIVPVTENAVGPVGDKTREYVPSLFGRKLDQPGLLNNILAGGAGMAAEGNEEIAGNFFEGLPNLFANYLDEDGNTVYSSDKAAVDAYGNPMRDPNTPLVERIHNFGVPVIGRDTSIGKFISDNNIPLPTVEQGGAYGMFQPEALADNINSWLAGALISAPSSFAEANRNQRIYDANMQRLNDLGLDSMYVEPKQVRGWQRKSPSRSYLDQYRH